MKMDMVARIFVDFWSSHVRVCMLMLFTPDTRALLADVRLLILKSFRPCVTTAIRKRVSENVSLDLDDGIFERVV